MRNDPAKWEPYLKSLPKYDIERIALVAIERLMQCEEVHFREADEDPEDGYPAGLCWDGSGEDIRK